jgi:membrane-bound inhibitor of C-type lysozyme
MSKQQQKNLHGTIFDNCVLQKHIYMKAKFLSTILVSSALIISSCQNSNNDKKIEDSSLIQTPVKNDSNNFITDSLIDDKGNKLDMKFDNNAGTVTLVLKQDTILLKQDTTASGMKYSNENYVLNEHQGETTLTKDGNILFFKKK